MANESNSSVVRVHKNTDFTIMSNHHLRNQKLSLKAIGLMSKILGLPCDWNYSIAGLVKIGARIKSRQPKVTGRGKYVIIKIIKKVKGVF